jgi:hypothetical protein
MWERHGIFGGTILRNLPSGNEYLVIPNAETSRWEVFVSHANDLFHKDDRTWHTKSQAQAWAEDLEKS